MDVEQTLIAFDEYLEKQGASFEAVIIGGAALVLMGVITRDTADVSPGRPKNVEAHFLALKKKLGHG